MRANDSLTSLSGFVSSSPFSFATTCDIVSESVSASLCAGFVLVKAGEGAGCWFKRGPASLKPLPRAGTHLCAKKEMGSLPTLPPATQESADDSDNYEEHHTGL